MKENKKNRKSDIVDTVLRGLGVAMGIVVVVLSALGKVDTKAALTMLGLGLASLFYLLTKGQKRMRIIVKGVGEITIAFSGKFSYSGHLEILHGVILQW